MPCISDENCPAGSVCQANVCVAAAGCDTLSADVRGPAGDDVVRSLDDVGVTQRVGVVQRGDDRLGLDCRDPLVDLAGQVKAVTNKMQMK